MLFYFANNSKVNLDDVMRYVELVLEQFPQRISATQLSIAIETIGKKILSNPISYNNYNSRGNTIFINSAEKFFIFLLNKYSRIEPVFQLNPNQLRQYYPQDPGGECVIYISTTSQ